MNTTTTTEFTFAVGQEVEWTVSIPGLWDINVTTMGVVTAVEDDRHVGELYTLLVWGQATPMNAYSNASTSEAWSVALEDLRPTGRRFDAEQMNAILSRYCAR